MHFLGSNKALLCAALSALLCAPSALGAPVTTEASNISVRQTDATIAGGALIHGNSSALASRQTAESADDEVAGGQLQVRQVTEVIELAEFMFEYGPEIFNFLTNLGSGDSDAEGRFTQKLVASLRTQYPKKNALVFHNAASPLIYTGGSHEHYELALPDGFRTYGYEIWLIDSGKFTLVGDGGFVNWCFDGKWQRNGRQVTFTAY